MKTNQQQKDSTFYKGMVFFKSLLFSMIYVVTSLYEARVAGLSGAQLVMVGTTLEITIFLFEIPTGIVADIYSRRLSIIIGFLIIGAGFIVEGFFPFFAPILIAQILKGVGFTFTSGAEEAWLSDEIGEKNANRTFLQANKFDLAGALIGMAIAIPLGNFSIKAPFLLGGPLFIFMGLCLMVIMPEKGFKPLRTNERHSWNRFFDVFRKGFDVVKQRADLRTALSAGFIYGLYSEGWDRLWVKHLITRFSIQGSLGISEVTFLGLLRGTGVLIINSWYSFCGKKVGFCSYSIYHQGVVGLIGTSFSFNPAFCVFSHSPFMCYCGLVGLPDPKPDRSALQRMGKSAPGF